MGGIPLQSAAIKNMLPTDTSSLASTAEPCHCVVDAVLSNRYNTLRAEEHARRDGKCGPEWSTSIAQDPENAIKNRYAGILPWNHSRVLLPVVPGESDYINASWIELGCRTYIATQGPMRSTVDDFWQMVYAYGGDPAVVVMLTPLHELGMEKCTRYWPEAKGKPLILEKKPEYRFGLEVSSLKHMNHKDQYEYSQLKVTPINSDYPPHIVNHVYYHTWLDFTKPNADADLRALIYLINNTLRNQRAPPIIHCSAGIGRTGTYIAMDALLCQIDKGIAPAHMPDVIPFWEADQTKYQFKKDLFTGGTDHPVEVWERKTPVFSKFDMSAASGTYSYVPNANTHYGDFDADGKTGSGENSLKEVDDELENDSTIPTPTTKSPSIKHQDEEYFDAGGNNSLTIYHDPKSPNSASVSRRNSGSSTKPHLQREESAVNLSSVDTVSSSRDNSKPAQKKSSALCGPVIEKISPNIVYVAQDVFSETPRNMNVMQWYDPEDPVMSTIRIMRKQRPKLVQGKQQLGYIYDQFEVGRQLARATSVGGTPPTAITDPHKPEAFRRSTTMPTPSARRDSHASTSGHHHHDSNKFNLLNLMGIRRHPTDVGSKTEPSSPKKWSPFHSSKR